MIPVVQVTDKVAIKWCYCYVYVSGDYWTQPSYRFCSGV